MSANLPIRLVEKPWGVDRLPPPFATHADVSAGERIGEIWFEPLAELPQLLIKYIFTSEKLSVQVHPSEAQTLAKGLGKQGKEECWLVIAAEPGAELGIGFKEPISADAMRAAALDGSIETKMVWHEVAAGDFFYIPANTVHAIGAGVSVIEIQQNSDITYRLFDYGRPRELHLDDGMAVAKGEVYDRQSWHKHLAAGVSANLVDGPWFRLDQVKGQPAPDLVARYEGAPLLVVPIDGDVRIADETVVPGGCGFASKMAVIDFADSTCLVAQPVDPRKGR